MHERGRSRAPVGARASRSERARACSRSARRGCRCPRPHRGRRVIASRRRTLGTRRPAPPLAGSSRSPTPAITTSPRSSTPSSTASGRPRRRPPASAPFMFESRARRSARHARIPPGGIPESSRSHGSRPEYDVSRCPLNITSAPALSRPGCRGRWPGRPRPAARAPAAPARPIPAPRPRHSFLRARERRRGDESHRQVDEVALLDHRKCGSTCSPKSRICAYRSCPTARASRACSPRRGTPRSRRCSPSGPGNRLALVEQLSVTSSLAAGRPPRSIASATGRISSCSIPASSSRVSSPTLGCSEPCSRGIFAASHALLSPGLRRSSATDATTVQPMSMSLLTFSRV